MNQSINSEFRLLGTRLLFDGNFSLKRNFRLLSLAVSIRELECTEVTEGVTSTFSPSGDAVTPKFAMYKIGTFQLFGKIAWSTIFFCTD